ncbi:MAG: 50S ribosomal protein L23 [Candidatus Pacebacteria bacterium]|nr:50S ribosomal protein L23 [Candidatus Paceibacterota bacterium]
MLEKKKNTTEKVASSTTRQRGGNNVAYNLDRIIIKPRVTEKATASAEKSVFVFDVASDANKFQIREAIKSLYKVEPVKINITRVSAKRIFYRGKKGVKPGGKKVYVYLKKGDKINIM